MTPNANYFSTFPPCYVEISPLPIFLLLFFHKMMGLSICNIYFSTKYNIVTDIMGGVKYMKSEEKTLNDLPFNTKGYIKKLNCNGTIRRRLLDLGFVEGASIIPVLISPSQDPRAFSIRGTLIAVRKEDANFINVTF